MIEYYQWKKHFVVLIFTKKNWRNITYEKNDDCPYYTDLISLIIYIGKTIAFSQIYSSHLLIEEVEDEPSAGNDVSVRSFQNEDEYSDYLLQTDIQIADSFDIELKDYILEDDYINNNDIRSNKIFFVYKYITEKYLDIGDRKPSVYSKNCDSKQVIILLQKKDKSCMMFQADLSIDFDINNANEGIVVMKIATYK